MNRPGRPFAALGGWLLDLWAVARGRPINPHSLSKLKILAAARRRTGATEMIEVGTYRGVTAARCARMFEVVHTIELSEALHRESSAFLARWKNVRTYLGDGRDWLRQILAAPGRGKVLVFLDGHFSGGETASAETPEPALEEIETLAAHRDRVVAVVIDDFRTFGVDPGTPSKAALLASLERHFPAASHDITVHLDQCIVTRR